MAELQNGIQRARKFPLHKRLWWHLQMQGPAYMIIGLAIWYIVEVTT